MTNADLKAMYRQLHRKYFKGELNPDMIVRLDKDIEIEYGHVYGVFEPPEEILINPKIKNFSEIVQVTILHEMVHASLGIHNHHGMRFQARIVELFNQGAYDGLL